jgi:hypothetical protein
LLRECNKLNGNPFQFNVHDLPLPAYVPESPVGRRDEALRTQATMVPAGRYSDKVSKG